MARLLVLHGPNLNLLGTREPAVYGHTTLADIDAALLATAQAAGHQLESLQANAEHVLIERKNVLNSAHFAKIQAGMSEEEVLRVIGPPYPAWTVYFKARDELVWEWRYCDDWNEPARFNVLFDGSSRRVRSTYAAPEKLRAALDFQYQPRWCGH